MGFLPLHRYLGSQAYPTHGFLRSYCPFRHHGYVSIPVFTDQRSFFPKGFAYDKLTATTAGKNAFVFLYCLTNFFQNFGPNTTTFIVPGEAFPTRYRSTAHGICAASGKLGAVVAQLGFGQLVNIGGTNKFVGHM